MDNYQALAAYYNDFTEDVSYRQWADFFEQCAARESLSPKLVLDLACGTGTLTGILAQRGFDMIGVDASAEMLMQAMNASLGEPEHPLFLQQRMEELDLYGTIDACVCCLDSINYVTDDTLLQRAFARVFLFLEPQSGLFVFDVNSPAKFARIDGNSYVREKEGVFCVWQAAVEKNRCAYAFDIFQQEQSGQWSRMQEAHEERIYSVEELTGFLERAGFRSVHVYGDMNFGPVTGTEDRLYFTARKEK